MAVSYSFDENGNEILSLPKSVSWLNEYIKSLIEEEMLIQDVYICAEISNFKHHSTGHMYFTLKDENSEIKAIMFRSYAYKINFKPSDGLKVIVHGRVGVYEKSGAYQLYVDSMQPDGFGALYLAYEQLKKKLADEGLFDESHKLSIPKFPSKIGIITSPTGAAIKDIIKVSRKRCPFAKLILFPASVQGNGASEELVRAVEYFNYINSVDVIIIGRGGGSIEDLWAFNDENLARSIYNSNIPIISAVGHEIDFTICDFVSDIRAATPSHAAELATPDIIGLKNTISSNYTRIYNSLSNFIKNNKYILQKYTESRVLKSPLVLFDNKRTEILANAEKLFSHIDYKTIKLKSELKALSAKLSALSPLDVLSRGYSVAFDKNEKVIKSITDISCNEKIFIKLFDGSIEATVDKLEREGNV